MTEAERFQPTRAGIINLWDYRDEEFVFADGRLVLRGPNGSGKTKALEVLFPFVLDGRIEPRRLNPFASEDRTMKSNLLYRGQDAAYAYVWLEFACGGTAVTVGVGLRAQRHNDKVTRWYFVVDGRAGVDFSLLGPDDRPLTKKQLVAELGPDAVTDRAPEYRAMIDARLFGLGQQRYEQLLTLVLTLRRPQLAKHLDPKRLSQTLSDGLRPLDEELIVEAARSFDDMESVQRTLDELVQADNATTAFLASYTTYLRTHARAAADVLSRRRAEMDRCRGALGTALATRRAAVARLDEANAAEAEADQRLARHRATLSSLQHSTAYTHKEQLDKLSELVGELAQAARREREAADRAQGSVERLDGELREARGKLDDARHAISRSAAALAEDAADARIPWTAADAEPDAEFDDRVLARIEVRRDDVRVVREALQAVRDAHAERARYERLFGTAQEAVTGAEDAERIATERLEQARDEALDALARWWERHEPTVRDLELDGVPERLREALGQVGEPDAPGLESVFDTLTRDAAQVLRGERHERESARRQARDELDGLVADRDRIAAEQDDAPPAFATRTASRVDKPGAPLWRLVRFADEVPAKRAASIEAALEAGNLLDAWVHAEDGTTAEDVRGAVSDGYLAPLPPERRPADATLADVLVPEEEPEVPEERVRAVLSSIALAEVRPGETTVPTVSGTGAFAQGVQLGAHTKADAEYVGATARQRRREARLAEIGGRIAAAEETLAALERDITRIVTTLTAVTSARDELPRTGAIVRAMREQADKAGALRARRDGLDAARSDLDQAVAEVGDRERRLAKAAAERSLVPEAEAVDRVVAAIDAFQRHAENLRSARRDEATHTDAVAAATRRLDDATRAAGEQAEVALTAESKHGEQAEGLATLRANVGADVAQVLADIEATREAIFTAEAEHRRARGEQNAATERAGEARAAVTGAVDALRAAIIEAHTDARRLAPYAQREIKDLLRLPSGAAWPGAEDDWHDPGELATAAEEALAGDQNAAVAALPGAVIELHDEIVAATAELSPSEASLKSSKTRLSTALNDLQTQLSAAGHDYRPEWEADDDVIVVRIADDQGFAPIGDFARRIADARRDQEQLLTESERRILEDALLSRLAQQIHERTVDARDLISQMSTEMRSRRMSSGTTIGVRWELADSLDDEQREICRLLDRDASGLAPDELARMRAHFASRIKTTRAQHLDRAYADLLAEVLDYRRWRTFAFTLVSGHGKEERLTQSRHSTLSGGEQSVSLHLPLFAAAHVTLSSARPECPRLLALDEAFAGVDDTGRRELLGLTAQFDLDLFMTGYDLWATYDTVSACAHYDLSHSPVEHTVSALLLVWDGAKILADGSDDLAATLGSPGTRRRRDGDAGTLLEPDATEAVEDAE